MGETIPLGRFRPRPSAIVCANNTYAASIPISPSIPGGTAARAPDRSCSHGSTTADVPSAYSRRSGPRTTIDPACDSTIRTIDVGTVSANSPSSLRKLISPN